MNMGGRSEKRPWGRWLEENGGNPSLCRNLYAEEDQRRGITLSYIRVGLSALTQIPVIRKMYIEDGISTQYQHILQHSTCVAL
jgi:hypothetical protein